MFFVRGEFIYYLNKVETQMQAQVLIARSSLFQE
jgi:hypothetical protein